MPITLGDVRVKDKEISDANVHAPQPFLNLNIPNHMTRKMCRITYFLLLLLPFGMGCQEGQAPGRQSTTQQPDTAQPSATQPVRPDTLKPAVDFTAFQQVVPQGFECVQANGKPVHAKGDLNDDGRTDVALLLQDLESELPSAVIAVAHGMPDSTYRLGSVSGDFGPEPLHNPDPEMLAIEGEVLKISYQSMRWGVDLYFRSENRKGTGELWLIKAISSTLGDARGDGTGVCTTDYLRGKRVSRVKRWDAQKGELVTQPEKQETVPIRLKLFSSFNEDSVYAEQ
jgi:hypothetical protein